jgi:hypothetical protein
MTTSELTIPFNCPRCSRKLKHISSAGTTLDATVHVYQCSAHGRWRLGPEVPDLRPLARLVTQEYSVETCA